MDQKPANTFIHIGYPKCASTYLQEEVFPIMGNFADLTKQSHATKWMFLDDIESDIIRDAMDASVRHQNPEKNFRIISYEGLAPELFETIADLYWDTRRMDVTKYRNSKKDVVKNIAKVYPEASVIIIIREQVEWAISQYKMYWRRGHAVNGIDYYINHYENGYDKIIEQYQQAFGVDKVRVVPYELLRKDPEAFIHLVTHFVDPEFKPKVSDKRVNYAPDLLKDVSYQRNKRVLKNKLKHNAENSTFRKIWARLLWHGADVFGRPYYAIKYGKEKHVVKPSEETLKAIRPILAESNRKVEKLTGLDLGKFGYYLGET